MADQPNLTDEQRSNLAKLSAYLKTLPADYPKFAMSSFTQDEDGGGCDVAHVAECGTAACAAGHGPHAGIAPLPHETWRAYSERAFVPCQQLNGWEVDEAAWDWCFSGAWSRTDNTAHGAAARIDILLSGGVPDDAQDQCFGWSPLSYAVAA